MSKNQRLAIGMALVATSAIVLMFTVKNKKAKKKRLHEVAEEGYETAHDVLYPLKLKKMKRDDAI